MAVNAPDIRDYRMEGADIAWCPGCGNFGILKAVKQALAELQIPPTKVVMVSGIGQAAKMPHYLKANVFNGLHGRALPPATAIKAANPAPDRHRRERRRRHVRRGRQSFYARHAAQPGHHHHCPRQHGLRPDQRAGLARPARWDSRPRSRSTGCSCEPFNPLAVAIALDASFVARAFAGDIEQTKEIIKQAITHPALPWSISSSPA